MSDFVDFFEDVTIDWLVSATFYKEVPGAVDPITRIPGVDTKTLLGTVNVGFWVDRSQETNINDKFVNDKTGKIVVNKSDLTFTIDKTSVAVIDSEDYYIEGTDNIGFQNEILLLKYRKEY